MYSTVVRGVLVLVLDMKSEYLALGTFLCGHLPKRAVSTCFLVTVSLIYIVYN